MAYICSFANVYADHNPFDNDPDSTRHIKQVDINGRVRTGNVASSKPVQTMSKEEIEQLGLTNLADAVKKFAGTSVRDYGGIGGMKTVSVRNLGAHHTAVSYDGFTISNTQAGQIDIGRFTLDNVEEISLALGNADNMMQTARHYASAALLTINNEHPTFANGKKHLLKATLKGGSFGYISPNARLWSKLGERTSLSVDGLFMRADGAYPFTLVNGKETNKMKRYNSDIYAWKGEADLYHTFSDGSTLDTKAYWYYSERGLPGSVILYNNISNERLWDLDFFTHVAYTRSLSKELKLSAKGKYTHSWNKYEDIGVKYVNGKQRDVNRQDEYYGSCTIGWMPTSDLRLSIAQDIFANTLRNNINVSSNLSPSNPTRLTSLTALNGSWEHGRAAIEAHIVGTYAHEHVHAGAKPDDKSRLTPSASFSYSLLNDQSLRIRAMAKSTFRMPSFNDLYYLRMGNAGLRPEKAQEYNFGITWSGRLAKYITHIDITADAYYNNVTDKIVAFPSTYIWKMANFGKVHVKGIDFTLSSELELSKQVDLIVNAAYTYQKATDKLSDSATYGQQLPYTPQHSGNISAIVKTPWASLGYSVMMQGKRWSSQNTDQYKLDGYAEHSVSITKGLRIAGCETEITATVKNLFDKQYEIIKYYPMVRRSWEAKLKIKL